MYTKRNKKIAVVTGASSGMGRAFARELAREFPFLEELWIIARREQALEEVKKELETERLFVRSLPLNLAKKEERKRLGRILEEEQPEICTLVCSAGVGYQKNFTKTSLEELEEMTELNCTALTAVTKICLPYCCVGGRILLFSSAAAFLPQPGFCVYAATKAYVLSLARGLRRELAGHTAVTVVCPGPVDTEFLEKMGGKEQMPAYKKLFLAEPEKTVKRALRDSRRGKELSVPGISMKGFLLLCKWCPHSILMKCAKGAGKARHRNKRKEQERREKNEK